MATRPERAPVAVREAVADPASTTWWSTVCVWEIATKHALGKLPLAADADIFVPERMRQTGAAALPITHAHALTASTLPRHHADPFDRLLVAQAQVDGLVLVTGDPQLSAYDVQILWD